MPDNMNIQPGGTPIPGGAIQPGGTEPAKPQKPTTTEQTSSITTFEGETTPGNLRTPAEKLSLPKPTETTKSTLEELQKAAQCLQDYATKMSRTVVFTPANLQSLWTMFEAKGAPMPSDDELAAMAEQLASRTPEENAASLTAAVTNFAIGANGMFTDAFDKFLTNPDPNIPKGKEEERFSFLALMLLLNKLFSGERKAFLEGAQSEQALIEVQFDKKKATISEKGFIQLMVSLGSGLGGGFLSVLGPAIGIKSSKLLTENPTAQMLIAGGRSVTDTVSGAGQAGIAMKYDTTLSDIEKMQSRANFNKESFNAGQNAAKEAMNSVIQAFESMQQSMASLKRTIAGNV